MEVLARMTGVDGWVICTSVVHLVTRTGIHKFRQSTVTPNDLHKSSASVALCLYLDGSARQMSWHSSCKLKLLQRLWRLSWQHTYHETKPHPRAVTNYLALAGASGMAQNPVPRLHWSIHSGDATPTGSFICTTDLRSIAYRDRKLRSKYGTSRLHQCGKNKLQHQVSLSQIWKKNIFCSPPYLHFCRVQNFNTEYNTFIRS